MPKWSFIMYDECCFLEIVSVCAGSLWGWSSFVLTCFKIFKFSWKDHCCIGQYFDGKAIQYFRYCSKTGPQFIKTCVWKKWTRFKDIRRCGGRHCCLFPERWTELPLKWMEKIPFTFHLWVSFSSLKAIRHLLELPLLFEDDLFRAVLPLLLFLMVLALESLVRWHLYGYLLL